jgi:hypothetical protein
MLDGKNRKDVKPARELVTVSNALRGIGFGLCAVIIFIIGTAGVNAISAANPESERESAPMTLHMKSGDRAVVPFSDELTTNMASADVAAAFDQDTKGSLYGDRRYLVVQFVSALKADVRAEIAAPGVDFIDCIPANAYLMRLPAELDISMLLSHGMTGYYILQPKDKIPGQFFRCLTGGHSGETHDVRVLPMKDMSPGELREVFYDLPGSPNLSVEGGHRVFVSDMRGDAILELARFPFIYYIEPHSDDFVLDDMETTSREQEDEYGLGDYHTTSSRANYITSSLAGHLSLTGAGVVIGVGDVPYYCNTHVDLQGRHTVLDPGAVGIMSDHGVRTSGTAGGHGTRIPRYTGLAPEATVYTAKLEAIYDLGLAAPAPMVVTSNSWWKEDTDCGGEYPDDRGHYTTYSRDVDLLLGNEMSLLSLHSAGNSNAINGDFPQGYANINPSYASSKNVLAVGRKASPRTHDATPSFGPSADGRIKPDLVATNAVIATICGNEYGESEGSSESTPAVAGVASLLYQLYRQHNAGSTPDGALIKAVLMNSADYLQGSGPTFSGGYGKVNARRAAGIITTGQYETDELDDGDTRSIFINVPANIDGKNIASLKVMLYWHDRAASPCAAPALVNNLDLSVNFGATTYLPYILDPDPANVELPATTGIDNLNNTEQVQIEVPSPGTYEIIVNGTTVLDGPQKFWVVYSYVVEELQITFPIGGEKLFSGETRHVFWDSHGTGYANAADFVEYSSDGGTSWYPVTHELYVGTLGASAPWRVPEMPLSEVLVRVGKDALVSVSDPFTVSEQIDLTLTDINGDQVELAWNTVSGADGYELMRLIGSSGWDVFYTTTGTSAILEKSFISTDRTWVTVRAVNSAEGLYSQRAKAMPFDYTNIPPVANEDVIVVSSPPPDILPVYVLDNDVDDNGDMIYITEISDPSFGSVSNNSGKYLTYRANVFFVDHDEFTYAITDGRGGTDEATVYITTTPFVCCVGITGNVDGDSGELIDIGDLTALIAYLYIPPNPVPTCLEEANIDGDSEGLIDIGDLTALIRYLYIPPNPDPAECQ